MESKKKFALLFLIIIIICILIGFLFFRNNKKEVFGTSFRFLHPISYKENIEITLGEKIPETESYSEDFQNDIFWLENGEINQKVGTYYGVVLFSYQLYKVALTVVDKNPPTIQNVKNITVYIGDNINLEKQVTVTDDSNEEVKLVVKGEYSLEKEGEYSLAYEATDTSGNVATADFKLIVKKKEMPVSGNSLLGESSKGYEITNKNGAYYVNGILVANKTYSLSSNYAPGGLTKETNSAFEKMKEAAAKDGVNLKIISGYRSYNTQNTLYNNYVKRDGKTAADRYSARPGHSEHQTGMAFDVNSLEQSFGNTKEGIWLSENCYKYGFILRYPKGKESITGYMYEPWHFRYIGSEASNLYNNGDWITLEEYLGIDSKYAY